jgi:2-C-methyl-D-erythritol 2,4-cyclodiphosphate synthase
MRVGTGWDRHPLVEGRPLVLGGERFPGERGLAGHSDGDVLAHAACEAILGALGAGDLGRQFPDDDPRTAGADSLELLREVGRRLRQAGYRIANLDATVVAQAPRLAPRLEAMRRNLAAALGEPPERVSVKAKSPEGVGTLGRGEAIDAHAVVLIAPAEGRG